ncbi:hypothetical protein [Nostoc sp.]|uniref:hypothetical protein n=1 Tax=Nostoc sp. TaxID=1180 RepID=UPI002FFAD8EC
MSKNENQDLCIFISSYKNTLPFPCREAGWFHTSREKTKLSFKASLPEAERFGSGVKSHVKKRELRLMYFYFFV